MPGISSLLCVAEEGMKRRNLLIRFQENEGLQYFGGLCFPATAACHSLPWWIGAGISQGCVPEKSSELLL